jgi:hypothetical protein
MATELSKLEPWRFCTICDPESERSFSVERAYIKHLSSQRHLRKTNRPLDTFECPDCSKHFSRESEIHRHLINGRCSGTPVSRLISRPTTTSSKKHVLSVSPNGVPGKLHRTDAFTMDATVGSPRLFASKATVGHDTVQFMRRHSRTDAQTFVNRPLQRLVEDALPPRRAIIQVHGTTSLTSLLLHTQRQTGASIPLALSPVILHESVVSGTPTSCAPTRANGTETLGSSAYEAFDAVRSLPTSSPEDTKPYDMPLASMEPNKDADHIQWLSDAMTSASLKEDDLAHVQVRSVISSTPAASLSSLGSLFLNRSPKVLTPKFSFPGPRFPTILVRSFARSAEMPAPMLTELVGDGHSMAETSRITGSVAYDDPTMEVPVPMHRRTREGFPHLPRTMSPASGVEADDATSTQSVDTSLPKSDSTFAKIASAPALLSRSTRDAPVDRIKKSLQFAKNGERLLHCAGTGDALGAYAILMNESYIDINYTNVLGLNESNYQRTALIIAAKGGHYHVMYALLKASALRREQRLNLMICDQYGHTAMYVAADHERRKPGWQAINDEYLPFRRFLRTLTLVLCCYCFEMAHGGNRHDMRYDMAGGWFLGTNLSPVRGLGPCQWCIRLCEHDWPGVNDVEEINKCVQEAKVPMTNAKRAILMTKDWVWLKDDQH